MCPVTIEETPLILNAFDFDKNIQIYITAEEIYRGERRMYALYATYPNIVS